MEIFKKIWFLFLLALLFLPMMQSYFNIFPERQLDGAFVEMPKPNVTMKAIMNETVQDSITAYCTEQTGFRKTLIRLNNQFLHSVFHKDATKGFVTGKDGVLFEESYILSYIGQTFVGKEKVDEVSSRLKLVQDMLAARNVTLLTVFAPGKASFYPELIPDHYLERANPTNNYKEYVNNFDSIGVNYIDFNRYFCNMKDTVSKAIYCNLGAHWTIYAASLAMDSLASYMEGKTGKKHAHLSFAGFTISDTLINQDDDIYKSMNLMFPLKHNRIDNPILKFNDGYKPKVLSISDSYWWTVWAYNVAIPQNIFSDGGFWFYNRTIYPERNPIQNVDEVNYSQEIEQQEFVLLVTTEATNHLYPFDFCNRYLTSFDDAFAAKSPDDYDATDSIYATYRQKMIDSIKEEIKANPEWYENVKNQALEKNISEDESIEANAIYTYRQRMTSEISD